MKKILDFLTREGSFLWEENRFRIISSRVATHPGRNDATLTLRSESLFLTLICERDRLFAYLQATVEPDERNSYVVSLAERLLTGREPGSDELDGARADFLATSLDTLEELFASDNYAETKAKLDALKEQRTQERFG